MDASVWNEMMWYLERFYFCFCAHKKNMPKARKTDEEYGNDLRIVNKSMCRESRKA